MAQRTLDSRRSERGAVALMMLVIGILIAGTSLVFMNAGLRTTAERNHAEHGLRALSAAHMGLLASEMEIISGVDPDGDGLGTISGSMHSATYVVTATDLGGNRFRQLAVARQANARRRIEVGIRVTQGGLFTHAMFAKDSVKLTGGSHTDSYDSDGGSWASQVVGTDAEGLPWAKDGGHVGSNGEIVISGPVRGKATPGVGFAVDHGEAAWGSIEPRTEPLVVEDPSFDAFQAAFLSNDNLSIDVSDPKVSYDAAGHILLAGGGAPITLNAGTYIFNTLKMTGGGQLIIDGKVEIFITNYLEISGGGVANLGGLPADCVIQAHAYDFPAGSKHDKLYIKTSGGSTTAMAVYAPEFHLETSGGGQFFGALVGRSIVHSGGSGFHYDEALGRLGGSGTAGAEREYVLHLDD